MLAAKDASVYDSGRFAAYSLAMHRVIAPFSATGHEVIIIDFGCSSGRFDRIIKRFVSKTLTIGLDLDLCSLRLAQKTSAHHAVLADIRRAPFSNSRRSSILP
jgi:SAM-dependent methyltransferase